MRCLKYALFLVIWAFSVSAKTTETPTLNVPSQDSRQGGDTVETAFEVVGLPFFDTGTTIGFSINFYGFCPYPESGIAPDVCYVFNSPEADVVSVDLLGSNYDTTLMIYELNGSQLVPVECNDDFHPDSTSKIEDLPISAGTTYLIVVSGYNYASGNYVFNVSGETVSIDQVPWGRLKSLFR